ncbi:hypothetical protein YUYDRAFT_07369 [Streptomyces sp. ScaeMP-e48]|uniref:hypothetical protein n=1 Tax=Streptomyces sp. ScaeMP-e48 TaxID=1100823 RepID=UPI000823A9A0|nr:hypothetical protein [Streptomyces sp. ScaeMP-e48]SCK55620.1 hypothetical protein YUYDRAFT_07369 [Streptomyces sp. ScaeMP-e48]
MEALRVVVMVMVVSGIWAAWQRNLFPGTWAHTFHTAHTEQRSRLTQARRQLRTVDRDQGRAEKEAAGQVKAEHEKYEQRVDRLEREVGLLQDPGRGTELGRLGGLVLYEHAVAASLEGRLLPLHGLRARFDPGDRVHSLYLTKPDGGGDRAKFPHRPDPTADPQDSVRLFDEEELRDFEVRINEAAAQESAFRAGLAEQQARKREELAEARKDTTGLKAAEHSHAEVREHNRSHPRRKEALADLTAARDRWQDLTGRRPPT